MADSLSPPTATSFPLFPKLPFDVRLEIYRHAAELTPEPVPIACFSETGSDFVAEKWPTWLPPICLTAPWVLVESVPQILRNRTFQFSFDQDFELFEDFLEQFEANRRAWMQANPGLGTPIGPQGPVRGIRGKVGAIDVPPGIHVRSIASKDVSHGLNKRHPIPWLQTRQFFVDFLAVAPLVTRVILVIPFMSMTVAIPKPPPDTYPRRMLKLERLVALYHIGRLVQNNQIKTVELVANYTKYEAAMSRFDPLRVILAIRQWILTGFGNRGRQDVRVDVFRTGGLYLQHKIPLPPRDNIIPQPVNASGGWMA